MVQGETGLLMLLCDAAALAEAIKQLSADVNLRRQMGESGSYFVIAANLRLIAI
jgi:glycosyltransferase involved in cell wall biosynthesis